MVREIEISGQVTSNTNALFATLKNNEHRRGREYVCKRKLFQCGSEKIQLRNTFDVTCTTSYRFDVFTPLGRDPIGFTIPMKVRMTGMSEVLEMIYITYIVTFIILVFYSVLDIKYREIPAWLLYAGTVVVFALGIASRLLYKRILSDM